MRNGVRYDATALVFHVLAVTTFTGIVAAILARVATELTKTPTVTASQRRAGA